MTLTALLLLMLPAARATEESNLNPGAAVIATTEAALKTDAKVPETQAVVALPAAEFPAEFKGAFYTGSEDDIKKIVEALGKTSELSPKELSNEDLRTVIIDALAQITAEKKEFSDIFVKSKAIALVRFDMSKMFYNPKRTNVLIAGILLLSFIGYFTYQARQGKDMFIRKIAGLSAIDDAVGRATEMGKPVLFIPGIYDMDDIQTIAGVSILGHVAKKTAEYETNLLVPCTRSLVMSTAQEVVREAYLKVGRADSFKPENIRYLTDDQFGYVAGVDGIMMREKPAANFYLGVFFAESLILAETGHHVGAIQIAGTAMVHQIPFFVAACDYTLIGEELFAASAYLSREPMQLGTLKGQDVGKFLIIIVIILGVIMETAGFQFFSSWFITR